MTFQEILQLKVASSYKTFVPFNTTMGIEFEFFGLWGENKRIADSFVDEIIKMNKDTDASICADDASDGLEYTTPILSSFNDLEKVLLALDVLNLAGAKTNSSCGLHFHLGITNFNAIPPDIDKNQYHLELVKNFVILYYRFAEPQFAGILRPHNKYCKSHEITYKHSFLSRLFNTEGRLYASIRRCTTLEALMQLLCPYSDRFFSINILSLHKYGTIEVRRHNGCLDREVVKSMASALNHIMGAAIVQTNSALAIQPAASVAALSFKQAKKQIGEKLAPSHRALSASYAHGLLFSKKKDGIAEQDLYGEKDAFFDALELDETLFSSAASSLEPHGFFSQCIQYSNAQGSGRVSHNLEDSRCYFL